MASDGSENRLMWSLGRLRANVVGELTALADVLDLEKALMR